MKTATTSIVHETRTPKKDGTYPIKLRVTFLRKQKYYSTGKSCTKEEFLKVMGIKPGRDPMKDIRNFLMAIQKKADAIIEKIPKFTFEAFEEEFGITQTEKFDVFSNFQRYINKLENEGRVGTAMSYRNGYKSLKEFSGKPNLDFNSITPDFLHKYERWMLENGRQLTTVGIYLRSLRVLINLAISKGIFDRNQYPFGKHRYVIPAGRNIKKALTAAELEKIIKYPAIQGSPLEKAKDLWVFSYLCNGMNFSDIARLKFENIDGNKIVFLREKTSRTSRQNQRPVIVTLLPEAEGVILKWGNAIQAKGNYVFPILSTGLTPHQEKAKINLTISLVNNYIGKIAEAVGIEKKVTTYTARHCYSTMLKRSGVPIEFISESLGHKDIRTTESYLDSFEDKHREEFSKRLLEFGGEKSHA